MTSAKLLPFGTSIFSEMTRLALEHGAINLSQGFPDFDGPAKIIEAAEKAMRDGHNQYARSLGHPLLVQAIARSRERDFGTRYDPMTEVVVVSGATEGIASSMLGLLDPGDEVILFEPHYDSYPACVAMAGAIPRVCTLRAPDFALDLDDLAALFSKKTRLLLLNSPHNPTGKVFTAEELAGIAALCQRHGVIVLADEVYEQLTYDGAKHIPIASLPGMRERTLTISSAGKTYSMTGWKVGWALGPANLVAAAQAAHQFVTFATATPLQVAMAHALTALGTGYLDQLRAQYLERRDFLAGALRSAGFEVQMPQGTCFLLAEFARHSKLDDRGFARELVERHGIASVPLSVFYSSRPEKGLLRFAFCKKTETLQAAARRLEALARR